MKYLIALCLISLLGACSPIKKELILGGGARTSLMPPSTSPKLLMSRHQATLIQGKQELRFEAVLEYSQEETVLVGLTPFGNRAFSIIWDGNQIKFEKMPFYPLNIEPAYLLSAFQLAFYPSENLKNHLQQDGLTFAEKETFRAVRDRSRAIAEIHYQHQDPLQGEARVDYHAVHFQLTVTTHGVYRP